MTVYGVLSLGMFGQGLLPDRVLSGSDQLWSAAPWSSSAPPLSRPFGANPELFDAVNYYEPFLEYARESVPALPLWNPYIMSGRPFLANAQSALLSPFSAPWYVLPRRVSPAVSAALKVFVAALGTFLLARAFGFALAGALLAGLVYGFGQFTVDWVMWPENSVRVMQPWLLLLAEWVLRRPRALPAAALAVGVALQFFGGHPEASYYVVGVTVAFALFRLGQLKRAGKAVTRPGLAFASSLAVGTALAAIVIAPFVELLLHSADLESRTVLRGHISSDYLLGVFMPGYWGSATQGTTQFPFGGLTLERAFYAGALPLMLAAGALLRPSLGRILVGVTGLCCLAVVVGIEPVFSVAQALPGPVRTDRLVYLFLLAVALLAGLGIDDLMATRLDGARRRALLAFSAALVCFPLAYVALFDRPGLDHLGPALTLAWGFDAPKEAFGELSREAVLRLGALLVWLPVAAAGAALVALRVRWRMTGSAFATLALTLTVLDLFKVSMGYNPAVPTDEAVQPATGAIRYLQEAHPERFVQINPGIPANVAMRYGLLDARGYDYPVIDRYMTFWDRNIVRLPPTPHFHVPSPDDRALRALGNLSVRYLMQDPRSAPLRHSGLVLAYEGGDARVYRNTRALPRAFVVERQSVAETAEQARVAVESPGFDGRATAITEEPVEGLRTGGPPGRLGARTASITSYEAERVVIRATAARPSLLVLGDSYYPGWQVEVDGEESKVHRVNFLMRGVRLPPGQHEVIFTYRPASYRAGLIVSVLALITVVISASVGYRRRNRPA